MNSVLLVAMWAFAGDPLPAPPAAPPAKRVSQLRDYLQHLQWSPDGSRFLFTRIHKGKMALWTMDRDGGDVKPLLPKGDQPHFDGHWSPDGKRIAFTSNRDGNYEIYVMDADGQNPRNLTNHPGWDNFPTWSPDSKHLAFISNRAGGYDVYIVPAP